MELVDLTEGGAESCISPVLAINFFEKSAGVWLDDKPTVCGGTHGDSITGKCYSYEVAEGSWVAAGNLLGTR